MAIQKLIFTLCFLGLLVVSNQHIHYDDTDNDTTVTHPSVFHEEYSDFKTTVQGSGDDHLFGSNRPPKSLDLSESNRSIFDQINESSTSSSDTSDATDASETSDGTSDSDDQSRIFENISRKAKELEGKALSQVDKQRKLAKLQARKYWQALKFKIMNDANGTNLSAEEVKAQLKSAKRTAKQKWEDLKWKIRNGNDILDDLMSTMDDLNPNVNNKKGSTEPVVDNDTAISNDTVL